MSCLEGKNVFHYHCFIVIVRYDCCNVIRIFVRSQVNSICMSSTIVDCRSMGAILLINETDQNSAPISGKQC